MRSAFVAVFCVLLACGSQNDRLSALAGGEDRDPDKTPGDLCTRADSDFDELRYREQIPHCRRNVTSARKRAIGLSYGVQPGDMHLYEVDHFIPLSVGGSNDDRNLWPLIKDEARRKARFEQQLFLSLERGDITQAEAIQKVHAWR